MAQIVTTEADTKIAVFNRQSIVTALVIGAIVGALLFVLTFLLERFLIEPLFCGSPNNFSVCTNGGNVAGNLALVFGTVFGAFALVRYGYYRPLVIAIAAACALWGLSAAIGGLSWFEILVWSVVLSALAYLTFAWLARLRHFALMLVIVVVAVVIVRLVVLL